MHSGCRAACIDRVENANLTKIGAQDRPVDTGNVDQFLEVARLALLELTV